MGLFDTLLLGPVKGVVWIAEQVREAAEREYYDEEAVVAALARLNEDLDAGRLSDQEFARREDDLLARLAQVRARARRV